MSTLRMVLLIQQILLNSLSASHPQLDCEKELLKLHVNIHPRLFIGCF